MPLLLLLILFACWSRVQAVPFGIYDPHSMAMGGTGVASATSANAHYYNPAMLAIYNDYKEKNEESRSITPTLSAVVTDKYNDIIDFTDRDYTQELSDSINAFNASPSPQTAQEVAGISRDLDKDLGDISAEILPFDIFLGLATGIASKRQGGAFFLQSRAVGSALLDLSEEDSRLLNSYIGSMTFLATGGEQGELDPDLFNANGQLLDLTGNLTSVGIARGAFITESGVAVSDETKIRGHDVMWGVTPKIQVVTVFDYFQNVQQKDLKLSRDTKTNFGMNVDVGLAKEYGKHYRFGLVIKDLWPRDIKTDLRNTIEIRPQGRGGITYFDDKFTLSVDFDLWPNDPIGIEDKTMFYATGIEYKVAQSFALRSGYRHNLKDVSEVGLLTIGFGWTGKRGFLDLAAGKGNDSVAAALQYGTRF